jgi:hypothetical protein
MRHARPDDLDGIVPLLDELGAVPGLKEKSRGVFYRGSKAFLHFHVDDGAYYADVRLDGAVFERVRATTKAEQRALVRSVRAAVQPA